MLITLIMIKWVHKNQDLRLLQQNNCKNRSSNQVQNKIYKMVILLNKVIQ